MVSVLPDGLKSKRPNSQMLREMLDPKCLSVPQLPPINQFSCNAYTAQRKKPRKTRLDRSMMLVKVAAGDECVYIVLSHLGRA